MEAISSETESRILEAARKEFIMNGLEGTSMQQIANEAKINKSLLHYYFRTKDKLFSAVFTYAFQQFVPHLEGIINSEDHIFIKIEKITSEYIDLLMRNRFIPIFVLHEINRNPQLLFDVMLKVGVRPDIFINQLEAEIRKNTIKPIDARHLIINILSLCIFPIAARPLAQRLFFNNDPKLYQQFLEERKKLVAEFIINSIRI